jgi:hypothetical protein
VTIINEHGRLTTNVYRKSTAEAYFLPYTSDHPHRYHRNIAYSALVRASQLCSNYDDFNQERLRIDLALLLSDYSPKMISNQSLRFFQVSNTELDLKQADPQAYGRLHRTLFQHLLDHPSVLREKPWKTSIACPKYTFESGPRTRLSREFCSCYLATLLIRKKPSRAMLTRMEPTIQ